MLFEELRMQEGQLNGVLDGVDLTAEASDVGVVDVGYLLKNHPSEGPPEPIDNYGYFDNSPQSVGYDFRRQAITMLEAMGISVEFSHHEGGPGQQEIDLRYADALTTADNLMTFRTVVKEVTLEQGVYATFMPKPFRDAPGSGMHTHVSLFEGDRNAFYEPGAPRSDMVSACFFGCSLACCHERRSSDSSFGSDVFHTCCPH
mgnify:CR=1 FL=1